MTELLKFLSTNSPAALAFGVAVLILAVTVSVICVVAFVQGRSISFWPPSIGERPKAHALLEGKAEQDEEPFESRTSPPGSSSPVVSRNTTLQGASGITYRVTSGFYGGANATLYKADDQKGAAVIAKYIGAGWLLTRHRGSYSSKSSARPKFSTIATSSRRSTGDCEWATRSPLLSIWAGVRCEIGLECMTGCRAGTLRRLLHNWPMPSIMRTRAVSFIGTSSPATFSSNRIQTGALH